MAKLHLLAPSPCLRSGPSLALYCRAEFGPGLRVARAEFGRLPCVAAQMITRIRRARSGCAVFDRLVVGVGPRFGEVPLPWRPRLSDIMGALEVDPWQYQDDLAALRAAAAEGWHRLMIDPGCHMAALVTQHDNRALPLAHALVWRAAGLITPAHQSCAWVLTQRRAARPRAPREALVLPRAGLWADPARHDRARRIAEALAAASLSCTVSPGIAAARARLGELLWAVVSDCLGARRGILEVEKRHGLPGRSAKALLAVAVDLWPEEAL